MFVPLAFVRSVSGAVAEIALYILEMSSSVLVQRPARIPHLQLESWNDKRAEAEAEAGIAGCVLTLASIGAISSYVSRLPSPVHLSSRLCSCTMSAYLPHSQAWNISTKRLLRKVPMIALSIRSVSTKSFDVVVILQTRLGLPRFPDALCHSELLENKRLPTLHMTVLSNPIA